MFDLINEILQTLRHNKLRTALTGFAVAWGIFLLIALLGMSRGAINSFNDSFSGDWANSASVWGGSTTKPHKGYKEGRSIRLDDSDLDPIFTDNSNIVSHVSANKDLSATTISTGRDYISNALSGVFPDAVVNERIDDINGRFINQADIDNRRKVIVISHENAETLFDDPDHAVGKRVNAMGLSWLVIGVYTHEWNSKSFIPYSTAISLSGFDNKVSGINVTAKDLKTEEDGENFEKAIRATLAERHEFDSSDDGAVYIWNRFSMYITSQTGMSMLTTGVWILGILTLLSGIVGVSNIMFVSVRERTHEIGIRRAIGAKPRSILTQIVAEAIAITTLFGYVGVVLGMALTRILGAIFNGTAGIKDQYVDISIALQVTVVLIIAGAFAGLFPAIKATKVKPVEALRDE